MGAPRGADPSPERGRQEMRSACSSESEPGSGQLRVPRGPGRGVRWFLAFVWPLPHLTLPRAPAVMGSLALAGVQMAVASVGVTTLPAALFRGTSLSEGALWAIRRSCGFPRGPPGSTLPSSGPVPTTLVSILACPGGPASPFCAWSLLWPWPPGPAQPAGQPGRSPRPSLPVVEAWLLGGPLLQVWEVVRDVGGRINPGLLMASL